MHFKTTRSMSETVNQSLQKIVKGTGIVFLGTIIGMFLGFVSRVIVIRYITLSEYGIFSLAVTLMNIFATIAALGLQEGVARYIAYFRGKVEERKVKSTILSSIKISLATSVIFSSALFLLADTIATDIYHTPELSKPLKVFSALIPFTVLMSIIFTNTRQKSS